MLTRVTQFYLPPTCLSTSGMNHTRLFSSATERHCTFGWYSFLVPLRAGGSVGLGGLVKYWGDLPAEDGHPSEYLLQWPGIEPATVESWIQCRNHKTTQYQVKRVIFHVDISAGVSVSVLTVLTARVSGLAKESVPMKCLHWELYIKQQILAKALKLRSLVSKATVYLIKVRAWALHIFVFSDVVALSTCCYIWTAHIACCMFYVGLHLHLDQSKQTRHRASASVYSLTVCIRVMLPYRRNSCTDCKSVQ